MSMPMPLLPIVLAEPVVVPPIVLLVALPEITTPSLVAQAGSPPASVPMKLPCDHVAGRRRSR